MWTWKNTIINQKLLTCVKPEDQRREKIRDGGGGRDRYFLVSASCINVPCRRVWLLSLFPERKRA